MIHRRLFFPLFFFISSFLFSQGHESGNHPYVIRGEVSIDFEFIYAGHVDEEYPLDIPAASRRGLEETALFYSAMIYGWSFNYEVGERARQIEEIMELKLDGRIEFGDPALKVTDTDVNNSRIRIWTDYHLSPSQQRRFQAWRSGTIRNAQAVGFGPSFLVEYPGWIEVKQLALEDAARVALRAMLRSSERNRPKEANGFISLASFPRFYMDGGRMAVSARFRVLLTEIVPFAVH
ncbi:MAG: hypothetical protein LBU88_01185 [Treponema sp.]|jgi:hypothetical protein|nr:hypothetical protein [Treponema sp.]